MLGLYDLNKSSPHPMNANPIALRAHTPAITDLVDRYTQGQRFFMGETLLAADLNNMFLPYINLSYADLRRATIQGSDLRYANLCGANLSQALIIGSTLHYAKLLGADLREADLSNCDLSFADFRMGLMETQLEGANLKGADLRGAKFGPRTLQGALFDGHTRLDPEINPQQSGMIFSPS